MFLNLDSSGGCILKMANGEVFAVAQQLAKNALISIEVSHEVSETCKYLFRINHRAKPFGQACDELCRIEQPEDLV